LDTAPSDCRHRLQAANTAALQDVESELERLRVKAAAKARARLLSFQQPLTPVAGSRVPPPALLRPAQAQDEHTGAREELFGTAAMAKLPCRPDLAADRSAKVQVLDEVSSAMHGHPPAMAHRYQVPAAARPGGLPGGPHGLRGDAVAHLSLRPLCVPVAPHSASAGLMPHRSQVRDCAESAAAGRDGQAGFAGRATLPGSDIAFPDLQLLPGAEDTHSSGTHRAGPARGRSSVFALGSASGCSLSPRLL
jgi:hypothetical protein